MRSYDLIIVGAGSGDMLLGPELDGLSTAIVEADRFGGTCLNRGCIPSKMLVVAADAARAVGHAERLGIHGHLDRVDWPAIRDRVFSRIDPMHDRAVEHRCSRGIDVYTTPAHFTAPKVLDVGGERITAPSIVLATGSRPTVPAISGLDSVRYHTSDTIMRIDAIPKSLVIIGGGFVAAEMGHVFDAFGSDVTIVQRSPRLLMREDEDISARFTELAEQRFRVLLDTHVDTVEPRRSGVAATVSTAGAAPQRIKASALLVATGRTPNTDLLDAVAGGLALDPHGHVVTDETYRTSVPGVWALGDAANHFQLKHMANAETRLVRHNLTHPEDRRSLPSGLAPHALFAEPQVASVGLTEQDARERGVDHVVAIRRFADVAYGWALEDTTGFVKLIADVAYGWALEDTTGFVKLIADPKTKKLLGAHIIGPQASTLIQPLLQAMMLGHSVDQIGRDVLYIHPALTEVVEQALLEL